MRRPAWDDVAIGASIALLAIVLGYQTALIPSSSYAKVGPAVFPWAATAMLALLGAALAVQGLLGGWPHEQEQGNFDWPSLAWLLLGLFLNVALIENLGFIIASTLLFACTARAFGSRKPLRDASIGFVIALVSYIGFDRVLGYQIGSGLIERLF